MKYTPLIALMLNLFSTIAHSHNISEPDVKTTHAVYDTNQSISLRYHAQWNVDGETQKKLCKAYGMKRISFDQHGHPLPKGLSAPQKNRWDRLYQLCMNDGCYFCDAAEGSCESNTCGVNNEYCKPHLDKDGQPLCGNACADYAYMHLCQL